MANENCEHCGKKIQVTIFRGERYCSVDCKKALGLDTPSVGTMMFVTPEEEKVVRDSRQ